MPLLAESTPTQTYWLTRDTSTEGVLSDTVDVWLERPSRTNLPGGLGAMWLGPGDTGIESRFQVWTLAFAYKEVRSGTPANDRECLCVGIG